jgi:regulator of sigma D
MPYIDQPQELRKGVRGKHARRAVSRKLALYHQSLVDAFSADAASFFDRIMEQAEQNIQSRRERDPELQR